MDDDLPQAQQDLLEVYVGGAVMHIEETCEHALARQTWALDVSAWQRCISLPGGNVLAVRELSYVTMDGTRRVVDPADYLVRLGRDGSVRPLYGRDWPQARAGDAGVEVQYDVGYDPGELPKPLVQAILLMIGDADAYKGTKVEGTWAESLTVKRLLWPYRKIRA